VQITGPFTPVAGTPLTQYDPAVNTPSSVAVQVQNSSTFILVVSCGGLQYPIPAFTAATLPINQSQIILDPLYTQGNGGGVIVLGWLQTGESSPVPDGPLVGVTELLDVTEYGGLSVASAEVYSGGANVDILDFGPGTLVRFQSVSVSSLNQAYGSDALSGDAWVGLGRRYSPYGYLWQHSWLTGDVMGETFYMQGQQDWMDQPSGYYSLFAQFYEAGVATDNVLVTVNYDLLPTS
jgi:hypothetical protein